jgi:hypothetical protein
MVLRGTLDQKSDSEKLQEYKEVLQTVISTNKLTWKQNEVLKYDTPEIYDYLQTLDVDSTGWVYAEFGNKEHTLDNLLLSEKCGNVYAKTWIGLYYYKKYEKEKINQFDRVHPFLLSARKYFREAYDLGEHTFASYELAQSDHLQSSCWIDMMDIAAKNGNADAICTLLYTKYGSVKTRIKWLLKCKDEFTNDTFVEDQLNTNSSREFQYAYETTVKLIDANKKLAVLTRLNNLDIGSLVYYDVMKYIR